MPFNTSVKSSNPIRMFRIKLSYVIFALAFTLVGVVIGYASNNVIKALPLSQTTQKCHEYISMVVAGADGLDKAYNASDYTLKALQTKEQFKQSMTGLSTINPVFTQQDADVMKGGLSARCTFVVDNLPKTKDGRTDGAFRIRLLKHGRNWFVSTIKVN